MKKEIKKIVNKNLKNEAKVIKVMADYNYQTYDIRKETINFIKNDLKATFKLYPFYYTDIDTIDVDKIESKLNNIKKSEFTNLLKFTYDFTFKKDNVINSSFDSSKRWEFLHFYINEDEILNNNTLEKYFKIIKKYQNGKNDFKVPAELYDFLKEIHFRPLKDDKKIIDFALNNKSLVKANYCFDRFITGKVLDCMVKAGIIENWNNLDFNHHNIEPIIKDIIK